MYGDKESSQGHHVHPADNLTGSVKSVVDEHAGWMTCVVLLHMFTLVY